MSEKKHFFYTMQHLKWNEFYDTSSNVYMKNFPENVLVMNITVSLRITQKLHLQTVSVFLEK